MLCLKQFKLVGSLEAIDFKELGSLILRTKGLTTGWDEFLNSVLYEGPRPCTSITNKNSSHSSMNKIANQAANDWQILQLCRVERSHLIRQPNSLETMRPDLSHLPIAVPLLWLPCPDYKSRPMEAFVVRESPREIESSVMERA
jgi:hypothetical protein